MCHAARFTKEEEKRDTRRDSTAAFPHSPLNILGRPAHSLCQSARTHAIYQETQIDACSPPSFLRE